MCDKKSKRIYAPLDVELREDHDLWAIGLKNVDLNADTVKKREAKKRINIFVFLFSEVLIKMLGMCNIQIVSVRR